MERKQAFKALSKICLNNWHYIDRKILSFNKGVNFFTGHSGSGKSTVIDAMQIVLYANTDGRGFFNKAAADDSDRSLIEYLRGMVNIGENNESQYLRNKNFSSTIVLEFEDTENSEKQCIGVVFDVDTASNEVSRLFFRHKGGILSNRYCADKRCLTTGEVREYLQRTFLPDEYYCGPSNERFRRQLYQIYLGGLDMDKFPRLFRRAIPFRMNIRLEDFVKEYICMEKNIHIDDLQESVMQYGRMRSRIEETMAEVRQLREISQAYSEFAECKDKVRSLEYQIDRLEIMQMKARLDEYTARKSESAKQRRKLEKEKEEYSRELAELQNEYEKVIFHIAETGYNSLETELISINETLERLEGSRAKWQKTADALKEWKDVEMVPNQTLWNIEKFTEENITEEELKTLKNSLAGILEELEADRRDADHRLRSLKKEEKELREELKALKQGKKAYPREVEEARYELRNRLCQKCGKAVNVYILADLLDIRDERWHHAVEGYLGNGKLLLVTEPKYADAAIELYREMDSRKYSRTAVLDTGYISKERFTAKTGTLAEEVTVREEYIRNYIDFLLGNVRKCENTEELRAARTGITSDCVLYKNFRIQHINPDQYTRQAYIGEISVKQRIRRLEEKCTAIQEERIPLQELLEKIKKISELETLSYTIEEYAEWKDDISQISEKTEIKQNLQKKMKHLREKTISEWEEKKQSLLEKQDAVKEKIHQTEEKIWNTKSREKQLEENFFDVNEKLSWKEKDFQRNDKCEKTFEIYLRGKRSSNLEYLKNESFREKAEAEQKKESCYYKLAEIRGNYIRSYPNRSFSAVTESNEAYEELLRTLTCKDLENYREAAKEQAAFAVEHFREDFVYKIRSAIREAFQQKDELNKIISRLDFGKDKYQFVITPNKGPDGKYYKMFMDDSLEINPSVLSDHMDEQMDLFTMEHEEKYGSLMNELIQIFIPPENSTREELEEAKRNMEKYADYRTYLSFDMQQIVKGEKEMRIGLSRMIKKNSGGEGQNPLYIALLASFAQIYKINLPVKIRRPSTIRLVVLDEAFSKMDAEKVASCISLIRGLGFQAIISATNDKIQNYIENVDKTFVYANPDKRHISIQEFEKQEFGILKYNDDISE